MKNYFIFLSILYSLYLNATSKRVSMEANSTSQPTASSKPLAYGKKNAKAHAKNSVEEIMNYADTGVGSPYIWGDSRWSTKNRKTPGADCSGFVQKSWGYPHRLKTEEAIPSKYRLTTSEFYQAQESGYPWKRLVNVPFSQAQTSDAMVYRSKKRGHIFLVSKTENSGVVTLEARGKKYGIGYSRKTYAYLKNKNYKILRRK